MESFLKVVTETLNPMSRPVGLAATHKAGIRFPIPFQIPLSCHLPPTFVTADHDI